MSLWSRLFGGPVATPEAPYEPLDLAEAVSRAGRAEPAVAYVDPALRVDQLQGLVDASPTEPALLGALGAAQLALGQFDEGLQTLNRTLRVERDRRRVLRTNRIKGTTLDLYLNQVDKGVEHYAACAEIDPHWVPVKLCLAEHALRRGDDHEVERLLASFQNTGAPAPWSDAEAALHVRDHEATLEAIQVAHVVELLQCVREVTRD